MEKQTFVTREELNELMKQIEGVKSTIEILQDKELMEQIEESEKAKRRGVKPWKLQSYK